MSCDMTKKKLKLKVKFQQCAKCRVEYSTTDLVICDPCGGTFCEDCQDQEMCHDCFEEAICCKDKIDELNERHQQEIDAFKNEIAELKKQIVRWKYCLEEAQRQEMDELNERHQQERDAELKKQIANQA